VARAWTAGRLIAHGSLAVSVFPLGCGKGGSARGRDSVGEDHGPGDAGDRFQFSVEWL
jgi:hypothetical protein